MESKEQRVAKLGGLIAEDWRDRRDDLRTLRSAWPAMRRVLGATLLSVVIVAAVLGEAQQEA